MSSLQGLMWPNQATAEGTRADGLIALRVAVERALQQRAEVETDVAQEKVDAQVRVALRDPDAAQELDMVRELAAAKSAGCYGRLGTRHLRRNRNRPTTEGHPQQATAAAGQLEVLPPKFRSPGATLEEGRTCGNGCGNGVAVRIAGPCLPVAVVDGAKL